MADIASNIPPIIIITSVEIVADNAVPNGTNNTFDNIPKEAMV